MASDPFPGVNPQFTFADGRTELMSWSWEGIPGAVSRLLELGADPNVRAPDGSTALLVAIQGAANPDVVHKLLEAGADPNAKDEGGVTPLMYLVERKDKATPDAFQSMIFKALIDAGADLEARHNGGNTALLCAASRNNLSYARALVEAGARLDVKNKLGRNALDVTDMSSRTRTTRCANYLRAVMKERGLLRRHESATIEALDKATDSSKSYLR